LRHDTAKWQPSPGQHFDVGIAGGGLAGLSLSILLAKNNFKVVVFEKEKYPFHRVCGEYISFESWRFLQELGLPLATLGLPAIKKLIVSAPGGRLIRADLDLGGFGISRFLIDFELKKIADSLGVLVLEDTKVSDIAYQDEVFQMQFNDRAVTCRVAVGAFGKRSNLDVKWRRHFVQKKAGKLDNYIGVKYHIKTDFPADTIALHNFKDGYCGISKIEGDAYCLCYLTTAQNLKDCSNSIRTMEERILGKNPWLRQIFASAAFLFSEPVAISQISFDKKSLIENHVLMCGDAAGMITPLCGNGMSMALHTAKILAGVMVPYLQQAIAREAMEVQFKDAWKKQFQSRLRMGRSVQALFGREKLTNLFIRALQPFPFVVRRIIKSTHGKEF